MIRPLARIMDCTTFWGASRAISIFAAKRHFGLKVYGPYSNSRRRRARNWLRDRMPESTYNKMMGVKRAVFGPHLDSYED